MRFGLITAAVIILVGGLFPCVARAHPVIENALDVVIAKGRIVITARISPEQIAAVEAPGVGSIPTNQLNAAALKHAPYVQKHLRLRADGRDITADSVKLLDRDPRDTTPSSLIAYRIEYPLATPPGQIQIDQSFLREIPLWSASCIVRIRQENQTDWEIALLTAQQTAEFGCDWTTPATRPARSTQSDVALGATIRAYVGHGIMHILTGYDHMLFITALVLATTRLWDLVKVVTAFTIAHTITLALSVFNLVYLSEHVVEPMIALSIIFVAVQNIFWPERSRGWTRMVIAFAFGLFHGLGFAGGLKQAMIGMPNITLWAALISFSLGVEIAHQLVIIPAYGLLSAARTWGASRDPRVELASLTRQYGSAGISLAGLYFLIQAMTM